MNEALKTLAAHVADQRAATAADLRQHGGEKDHFSAMQDIIKNYVGADRARLKKFVDYDPASEYGRKYRAGLFRYFGKATEEQKLEIVALEAPTLKILSTYKDTGLDETHLRLSARALTIEIYKQLCNTKSFVVKTAEQKSKAPDRQTVLLNTLWQEVERLRREGYDFEQVSGILRGITKGRLKAQPNKIAIEYYKHHPEEKPRKTKDTPD